MNYYEELGIRADAEVEDIRKAHRRLVKLMHPDNQRDASMKVLAETQMRRLNSIVSTLLDPDQRGEYDEALRGRHVSRPVTPKTWRGVPWWVVSTVAATVLAVSAVWVWASYMLGGSGSSSPVYIAPREKTMSSSTAVSKSTTTVPVPPTERPTTPPVQPPVPEKMAKQIEPPARVPVIQSPPPNPSLNPSPNTSLNPGRKAATSPNRVIAAQDSKKVFHLPPGVQATPAAKRYPAVGLPPAPHLNTNTAPHVETASLTLSPLPMAIAPKPAAPELDVPPMPKQGIKSDSPLEGEWVYSPKEPERRRAGFYPPEFIRLQLSQHEGGLRGQYSARYEVSGADQPISPDVSFQFAAAGKNARKFTWQGSNGSRGTLMIRALEGGTMRIEWRTTVASDRPMLTSGIATLVRR